MGHNKTYRMQVNNEEESLIGILQVHQSMKGQIRLDFHR